MLGQLTGACSRVLWVRTQPPLVSSYTFAVGSIHPSRMTPGLAQANFCIPVLASKLLDTSFSICLSFYNIRTDITALYSWSAFSIIHIINCSHQILLVQLFKVQFVSWMDLTNVLSQGSLKSMLEETVLHTEKALVTESERSHSIFTPKSRHLKKPAASILTWMPPFTSASAHQCTTPLPSPTQPCYLVFSQFSGLSELPHQCTCLHAYSVYTPWEHEPSREVALFLPFPVIN